METKYYINTEGNDDNAYQQAVDYACKLANQDHDIKRIVLYIATKKNTEWFERLYGYDGVKQIFKGASKKGCNAQLIFETPLTYRKSQYKSPSDIVICCGLDSPEIFKIDDYHRVKYTIVIPWLKKYTEQWVRTWNAKEIFGNEEQVNSYEQPSDIVKTAMQDLTSYINMSTGLTHPMDNDRAKTYIRTLYRYEPELLGNVVSSFLIKELGWEVRHAKQVETLIDTLNNKKHFKGGETTGLRAYYDGWKTDKK